MAPRDRCSECLGEFEVKKDGTLRHHGGAPGTGDTHLRAGARAYRCPGSGKPPAEMHDPAGPDGWARGLIEGASGVSR